MAHISRLRGRGSFRRKQGHQKPRAITLVVCEGETERAYFEAARLHFRLPRTEVVVAESDEGTAPINVVDCAERKSAERGGYDQIFCVFDRDQHADFERARTRIRTLAARRARPLPMAEAVSIPCFEFWILLHYEKTDASFATCDEVIRRIRNQHVSGYTKADAAFCRSLMSRLNVALANADWLEARAQDNGYDPYTTAYEVIRFLQAAEGPGPGLR